MNAGTYYLYITGQNGYSGKIQKEYVIAQKDVSDATVEVTLQDNIDWDKVLAAAAADPDNASATLTSCIQEVKDTARADADAVDGVKNLVEGTDYTISLSKTGRGITLTGTGNYTGERYCGAPRNARMLFLTRLPMYIPEVSGHRHSSFWLTGRPFPRRITMRYIPTMSMSDKPH